MKNGNGIFKGVIRGRLVELEQDSGLPEGQQVVVTLTPAPPLAIPPGEGLRRAFGAWAEDAAELEEWERGLRQGRQQDRTGPQE